MSKAFTDQHIKWINKRRSSIIFDFLNPQKELKKPPKVYRYKKNLKTLEETEIDEQSIIHDRDIEDNGREF